MIPYSPVALQVIRGDALYGVGRTATAAKLGWPIEMLERVCTRHGIGIGPIAAAPDPKPASLGTPAKPLVARRCTLGADRTSMTVSITAFAKNDLEHFASEDGESVSGYVRGVLLDAVDSGDAARCAPYSGLTRTAAINVTMSRALDASLRKIWKESGTHKSIGHFLAAVIDLHRTRRKAGR